MASGPPVFASWGAIVFWAVFLWAFFPEFGVIARAKAAGAGPQDRGTMRLISLAGQASMTAAFVVAFIPVLLMPWRQMVLWVGTGLLLAGSLLRRACFRALGKHFTGAVHVTADQPVIETGAYRLVRHPSYTGGIMMFLGVGLALGSWLSAAILLAERCVVYAFRVRAEEAAMLATVGEPYRAYMSRTKRFIPFIV